MSDLSQCNYCTYQEILRAAKKHKPPQKIETKPEEGGVQLYIDGHKSTWFMALPDHCAC